MARESAPKTRALWILRRIIRWLSLTYRWFVWCAKCAGSVCVCVLVVRRWFIGGRLDTQHKCFDSAGDAALEGDLRAMFYVEFSVELHGDSDAFFMLLSCASLSFLMIWDFCGSQISELVPFFMGQVVKWRWSIWFVDVETSTIIKINYSKIYGSQCYTYRMIHFVSILCIF